MPEAAVPLDLPRAIERVSAFIERAEFPCVGARSALHSQRARFGLYPRLDDEAAAERLRADLRAYAAEFPEPGLKPVSFIAMFDDTVSSELDFERRMWSHLQRMDVQDSRAYDWDPSVSDDPDDSDFSFSVGGRAYFVVGLSPASSRLARRAPFPCLVFNFHDQFDALRASGKYAKMQQAIRARDIALQGAINPVLANFGDSSEARQYSGRALPAQWQCPFRHQSARPRTST